MLSPSLHFMLTLLITDLLTIHCVADFIDMCGGDVTLANAASKAKDLGYTDPGSGLKDQVMDCTDCLLRARNHPDSDKRDCGASTVAISTTCECEGGSYLKGECKCEDHAQLFAIMVVGLFTPILICANLFCCCMTAISAFKKKESGFQERSFHEYPPSYQVSSTRSAHMGATPRQRRGGRTARNYGRRY